MSLCVRKILFRSVQVCGCYCKMFRNRTFSVECRFGKAVARMTHSRTQVSGITMFASTGKQAKQGVDQNRYAA